jgi:hypothetical protein
MAATLKETHINGLHFETQGRSKFNNYDEQRTMSKHFDITDAPSKDHDHATISPNANNKPSFAASSSD